MDFRVSDRCQTASGGSYLVSYHAEVEALPGDGTATVEVVSTVPEDADPESLRRAIEAIRCGAESVLRPRGLRASLRLDRLFIHPVDCNPRRYQNATAEALVHVLSSDV